MKRHPTLHALSSSITGARPIVDREPAAPLSVQKRDQGINSRVLFAGGREVVIFHYGEPYHLRETRQGKLILTK